MSINVETIEKDVVVEGLFSDDTYDKIKIKFKNNASSTLKTSIINFNLVDKDNNYIKGSDIMIDEDDAITSSTTIEANKNITGYLYFKKENINTNNIKKLQILVPTSASSDKLKYSEYYINLNY